MGTKKAPTHPFTNARRDPPPGRRVAHYVALYGRPSEQGGGVYLRWVTLDIPDGLISPPTIELHWPLFGPQTFHYAQTQAEIAKLYGVTQQTVGRWLRREAPPLD